MCAIPFIYVGPAISSLILYRILICKICELIRLVHVPCVACYMYVWVVLCCVSHSL